MLRKVLELGMRMHTAPDHENCKVGECSVLPPTACHVFMLPLRKLDREDRVRRRLEEERVEKVGMLCSSTPVGCCKSVIPKRQSLRGCLEKRERESERSLPCPAMPVCLVSIHTCGCLHAQNKKWQEKACQKVLKSKKLCAIHT